MEMLAGFVVLLGLLLLAGVVYFLPTLIARSNEHRHVDSIAVVNLFLGWTLLGWVVALAWALTENNRRPEMMPRAARSRPSTPADAVAVDGIRHFYTKVAGVSRANADGTFRQELACRCRPLQKLALRPEPDNPFDPFAVAVLNADGRQLGYLKAELAEDVSTDLGRGVSFDAYVAELTGGGTDRHVGINLLVVRAKPDVGHRERREYFMSLLGREFKVR